MAEDDLTNARRDFYEATRALRIERMARIEAARATERARATAVRLEQELAESEEQRRRLAEVVRVGVYLTDDDVLALARTIQLRMHDAKVVPALIALDKITRRAEDILNEQRAERRWNGDGYSA